MYKMFSSRREALNYYGKRLAHYDKMDTEKDGCDCYVRRWVEQYDYYKALAQEVQKEIDLGYE